MDQGTHTKRFLKSQRSQAADFSNAVVTKGGHIVWLAGITASQDQSGKSLAGDFDGQVREIYLRFEQLIGEAGGTLRDIVSLTIFLTDLKYSDQFTRVRRDIYKAKFGDDFPASARIFVPCLVRPDILVEIQGVAVVG